MELINREEVLGYLQCEVNFWKDKDEKVYNWADVIKFEIEELPIIESRPKGKWIEDTGLYATCSNCKENLYQAIEYKYCPNCGADMRKTETWHTSKGNVEMPKGLFDKIYNDDEE